MHFHGATTTAAAAAAARQRASTALAPALSRTATGPLPTKACKACFSTFLTHPVGPSANKSPTPLRISHSAPTSSRLCRPSLSSAALLSRRFSTSPAATMSAPGRTGLTLDNINPRVKAAKYAVRGELAVRSEEYRARLAKGDASLPFEHVISANIGNPQQLDQKPLTFIRQVLSLVENPQLLEHEDVLLSTLGYPSDVIARAKWLLSKVGSVGAYSASNGSPAIRESIAAFLERRDGFPASAADIYMSAGASSGVNTLLNVICAGPSTGVLVPIPQYPLYTATLSLLDAECVPYYLDETRNWLTDLDAIRTALAEARAKGTDVRAIVVINPGNPTGASLSESDVEAVIELARAEKLVILADEVYQTNVFVGKFHSFKGALRRLQQRLPDAGYDKVELASLHSVSKGMVGECGHRGGYFELCGFDPAVQAEIYKFVSIMLCAPVVGQCLVELMVNPPREGDPSFPLYDKEYRAIYEGLRERSAALHRAFDRMEGVECGEPQGSMYLFPTIHIPPKAAAEAAAEGRTPDEFYSLKMLEATGVCVVPGSGFGQRPGSLHFRTTFLAPGTDWVEGLVKFHTDFMAKYK